MTPGENNNHISIKVDNADDGSAPEESQLGERGRRRSRSRNQSRSGSRSRSASHNRTRRDLELARRDASPLLPEDALPRQKPPTRGPEFDDEDDIDTRDISSPGRGIDDGLFDEIPANGSGNGKPSRRRSSSIPDFPLSPPTYGGPDVIEDPNILLIRPDINVYQHKKTLAQGMMDLALLSANANQLRYVIEAREYHPYFYFSITFIVASLIFQVLVGIGLVLNSRYNIKEHADICKADKINNLITVAILLITIINVFVSAFGVAELGSVKVIN